MAAPSPQNIEELSLLANAAKKAGVKGEVREVRNPVYSGPVMLWPKAFLDLYFKGGLNEGVTGKQLLKG